MSVPARQARVNSAMGAFPFRYDLI